MAAKKGDRVKISSWQANNRASGPTTRVIIGDVNVLEPTVSVDALGAIEMECYYLPGGGLLSGRLVLSFRLLVPTLSRNDLFCLAIVLVGRYFEKLSDVLPAFLTNMLHASTEA